MKKGNPDHWLGRVTVRQSGQDASVEMLYLEQLLLKSNVLDKKCVNITVHYPKKED